MAKKITKVKKGNRRTASKKPTSNSLSHLSMAQKVIAVTILIAILVASYMFLSKPGPIEKTPRLQAQATPEQSNETVSQAPLPTPTPASFENWQTYQNNQFKYSINYKVDKINIEEVNITSLKDYQGLLSLVNVPYASKHISITVWKSYDLQINDVAGFKTWCKKSFEDVGNGGDIQVVGFQCPQDANLKVEVINTSGKTAFKIEDWGIKTVFIPHNNYVYELLFEGNMGYYDELEVAQDEKVADYSLSTFKFL